MTDSRGKKSLKSLVFIVRFIFKMLIMPIVMSPDIVKKIVNESGFEIVKSNMDNSDFSKVENLYYQRDILMVLKLSD